MCKDASGAWYAQGMSSACNISYIVVCNSLQLDTPIPSLQLRPILVWILINEIKQIYAQHTEKVYVPYKMLNLINLYHNLIYRLVKLSHVS